MWSGFRNTIVENRVTSSIGDSSFGVFIAVFAMGAVEETHWSYRIDWVQLGNRQPDNYFGT
jgi:hypothetical protein